MLNMFGERITQRDVFRRACARC